MKKRIALIGDSVLDNFHWLKFPQQDVRQQLSNIMPNFDVYNYAVDESKTTDVLNGCSPELRYSNSRLFHFRNSYPYPTNDSGKVVPLDLCKKLEPDNIILSVGGNDGRVHLMKLMISAESLINAIMADNFVEKFKTIVRKMIKIQPKSVLVFVYKPHETIFKEFRNNVGWGLNYIPIENMIDLQGRLDKVYNHLRDIYIEVGKKYRLPIIDLSQTFNYKDRTHYGSTTIEPSNKSGQTIANLIKHVLENHDFDSQSTIYYQPLEREEGDIKTKMLNNN